MTTTENNATDTQAVSPDLTINDLNALRAIIDVASSRGAFKPTEMVSVGQAYTKLLNFLEFVAAQQQAQAAQASESVTETETV
jgi:monomeric isocitrate dehydrogenase